MPPVLSRRSAARDRRTDGIATLDRTTTAIVLIGTAKRRVTTSGDALPETSEATSERTNAGRWPPVAGKSSRAARITVRDGMPENADSTISLVAIAITGAMPWPAGTTIAIPLWGIMHAATRNAEDQGCTTGIPLGSRRRSAVITGAMDGTDTITTDSLTDTATMDAA